MKHDITDVPKNGVDFYLYMDFSDIENEIGSVDWGTKYVYGKALHGWNTGNYQCVTEYRNWVRSAYSGTVWAIVDYLSLKNNFVTVNIMGIDPYLICGLTNDRDELINCIDPNEFVLSQDSDGHISVNHKYCCSFDPYEEICRSAKKNRELRPKRKAVGIVIVQSTRALYRWSSDKEKVEQSVRDCKAAGIEIITIGIRNTDANHADLIKKEELKALSTNQSYSVVCNYETMRRHLRKIVEEKGGPIDYWWEAKKARDWEKRLEFLERGYKAGDAWCANEYGKHIYYHIYVLEIQQRRYLVRDEDAKHWDEAKNCFEIAAKKGIEEARIFLENDGIPENNSCKFMFKEISEIEIYKREAEKSSKESDKRSVVGTEESKTKSIASLVIGIFSLFCFGYCSFVLAVIGLILGIKGKDEGGRGIATAGIVLNAIAMVVWSIVISINFFI